MSGYTAEPWWTHGCRLGAGNPEGGTAVLLASFLSYDVDAERAAACVNACAGLGNEVLKTGVVKRMLVGVEEGLAIIQDPHFVYADKAEYIRHWAGRMAELVAESQG